MTTESKKPRPPRSLTEAERALWREVAHSVKPLRKKRAVATNEGKPVPVLTPIRSAAKVSPPPPVVAKKPPAPTLIDRRERQKLARGRVTIDRRIDLHGMTQAQAHGALTRFLHAAQGEGARFVLVITGKGRGGAEGVLRRQVPLWLSLPEMRELVVSLDTAAIAHGGEGALYVRLRKSREA
jgi:DNA-nicking Smr family endonuclease